MTETIGAFQAEIKALEEKLEAKKREMAAVGAEAPESHIFKAVVREHSGSEVVAPQVIATTAAASKTAPVAAKPSAQDETKLDELVTHAFTKGIIASIKEARKMNTPFIIDMLHDRLADEYYQKLLESRKINTH